MMYITALLLGLAGSLHCVGMCGPLLLALPLDAATKRQILSNMLVYHSGRILTYMALGLLFGLIGQGLAVAGLQKLLSIVAGFILIGIAFMAWRFEWMVTALPGFAVFTNRVKLGIRHLIQTNPKGSYFSIGLLNGLLPCGMVYAALASAISCSSGLEGSLFMAIFGAGTLPLLLLVSVFGRSLNPSLRQRIKIWQSILLCVVAFLLIWRGIHLDLSIFETSIPRTMMCH